MENLDEETEIWEEIDRAESYLVCSMFKEAMSSALSVLRRLLENDGTEGSRSVSEVDESETYDMLESAGMVLVQSMKQLQRADGILNELKQLFGSVAAIPFEVFLTGVCFQISDSPSGDVQSFLEEFLISCECVDGQYLPLVKKKASVPIGVESYFELVDLYVIKVLSKKDIDLAISWVEKAMLPTEKHQELLNRLRLIQSSTATTCSQDSTSSQLTDEVVQNRHQSDDTRYEILSSQGNTAKQEILRSARQKNPLFWWFPTLTLKLGNARVTIPSGKFIMALVILVTYSFMRKRQAVIKRFLVKKGAAVKRGVVDLWRLAFSYQVNPLAAVQTLPTASHGRSR